MPIWAWMLIGMGMDDYTFMPIIGIYAYMGIYYIGISFVPIDILPT